MTSMHQPPETDKPRIGRPPHGPNCPTCGASHTRRRDGGHTIRRTFRLLPETAFCPRCDAPPSAQKRRPWLEAWAQESQP